MAQWSSDQEALYKDLVYTTQWYLMASHTFCYLETLFALMSGALLTLYFTTAEPLGVVPRAVVCVVGFLAALSWYGLVSFAKAYSDVRSERMKRFAKALQQEVTVGIQTEKIFGLFDEQEEHGLGGVSLCFWRPTSIWKSKSMWGPRIVMSVLLALAWGILLIYTLLSRIAS